MYFIVEYSAWLWWYGQDKNMNDMGAFTLKAFMPTVFGQGKVAQFTTNSYPAIGFWLMVLFAGLLADRSPAEASAGTLRGDDGCKVEFTRRPSSVLGLCLPGLGEGRNCHLSTPDRRNSGQRKSPSRRPVFIPVPSRLNFR